MDKDAIFATNTSSLSITELATAARRPENVVGLHFFNPVNKMPLVEVIRGEHTSPQAVATAYKLALDLGKIPVICGDCPGFVVNRILGIYMNEAGLCMMEGCPIDYVDRALLQFGMPMGPFRLMDEVGLDVAAHVGPILEEGLGERYAQNKQYSDVLKKHPDVLGKKTKAGFYLYDEKEKQQGRNPTMTKAMKEIVNFQDNPPLSLQEIRDRCVLVMLNEACYILDEGIVSRPEDLDLAMVMGTGFAPFRGGLLAFADSYGLDNAVNRLTQLEDQYGFRFAPHTLLKQMAAEGRRFFEKRPNPRDLESVSSIPRSKL